MVIFYQRCCISITVNDEWSHFIRMNVVGIVTTKKWIKKNQKRPISCVILFKDHQQLNRYVCSCALHKPEWFGCSQYLFDICLSTGSYYQYDQLNEKLKLKYQFQFQFCVFILSFLHNIEREFQILGNWTDRPNNTKHHVLSSLYEPCSTEYEMIYSVYTKWNCILMQSHRRCDGEREFKKRKCQQKYHKQVVTSVGFCFPFRSLFHHSFILSVFSSVSSW